MRMPQTARQKELWNIFHPYLDGCHFPEGTPEKVLKAFEEWKAIGEQLKQEEINSWFE